jgi:ATP-dependent protease ClpP protease subunit
VVNQRKPWYEIKALAGPNADDAGPVEILIYDEISPIWGVSAADFVRDLAAIDADEITVRINSPGGSVFEGIAILNALRGHPATITTTVDSLAASIASVIALGGDKVVMNQNSTMMIHNAWDVAAGNADELQQVVDRLRGFSSNIASIYADKAGGSVADWQALMDAETWYTADEAVTAGLADEVINFQASENAMASYARASFDLTKFKFAGREAAPPPIILARTKTPQASVGAEATKKEKETPVATLNESLVEKLGLDAEADEDTILAKVVELAARPEKADEAPPVAPAELTPDQINTAAAKLGMTMVDRTQYETTVSAVAAMQARDAAQAKADDERIVDDAIKVGKLAPANKATWLGLMEKDRVGMRANLAQIPAGLIPVAEMGHGVGSELDHLDAEMSAGYSRITGRTIGKDA